MGWNDVFYVCCGMCVLALTRVAARRAGRRAGENMTCVVTPAAGDQDCVLQHKLVEQSVMDAVEDPARCEETWRQAFLGMSFCCFAAVLVFKVWGSARDITQKIDDEIAARRGGAATVESLGHVAALSGAMGGSAAPGFEHSNPLGEITAL